MNQEELKSRLFGSGTETGSGPEWGIVLGSGFDVWLEHLAPYGERVPFGDLDGLPPTTVAGHGGYFTAGTVRGKPVAIAVGRLHLYEGLSPIQVVEPALVLGSMGVSSVLFTTAVGSVDQDLMIGDGVVIADQINLTGEDPHTGTARFPDVSSLYDPGYIKFLGDKGLRTGVLAGMRGPSYETPAEVKALKTMGADVVCMSTALETLALAGTAVKCAGVGVVANRAGSRGLTHDDVLKVVRRSAQRLWPVVEALIASGSD